jgi:hypothetical protein
MQWLVLEARVFSEIASEMQLIKTGLAFFEKGDVQK